MPVLCLTLGCVYPFPIEAFVVCKGFQPPASLKAYLEAEEADPTVEGSLMDAFTSLGLTSGSAAASLPNETAAEAARVESGKILGWVGGGDLS